jgi:ABC-type multidrug transport system ATPase subunit
LHLTLPFLVPLQDEPTSGLDSYTADNLMHALKAVAARGRVVVASLHQPSRDVFHSLDQVVLMGHGRMLYMGPPSDGEAVHRERGCWWLIEAGRINLRRK